MKLNGLIFSHFYKIVTDHIYKHELIEKQREKFSSGGSSIWFARQHGNSRGPYIYDLYIPKGIGKKYFITKKSRLKPDSDREEDVDDSLIIHCLEKKLKREFPKKIDEEDAEIPRIRAKVLMQFFIKENLPKYYLKNQIYYQVYDELTYEIIFKNLNRKKRSSSVGIYKSDVNGVDENEAVALNSTTDESEKVSQQILSQLFSEKLTDEHVNNAIEFHDFIFHYFGLLQDRKLVLAFDCWDPDERHLRWPNGFMDFDKKFKIPFKYEFLHLFQIDCEREYELYVTYSGKLYFLETIIIGLHEVYSVLTESNFNDPQTLLETIRNLISKSGYDNNNEYFKKLEKVVYRLKKIGLTKDNIDILRQELYMLPEIQLSYPIERIFNVKAIKFKQYNKWYISSLLTIGIINPLVEQSFSSGYFNTQH